MKEKALSTFIEQMTAILESAKNFTLAQAPDILRQVVALGRASSTFYVAFGLLLVGASLLQVRTVLTESRKKLSEQNEAVLILGTAGALISIVVGTVILFTNIHQLLVTWVAPKVYLIEYFAALARSSSH